MEWGHSIRCQHLTAIQSGHPKLLHCLQDPLSLKVRMSDIEAHEGCKQITSAV